MRNFQIWFWLLAFMVSGQLFAGDSLWKIDDFDGMQTGTGTGWWTGCDNNKLGTTLAPLPFAVEKGGSPSSPKACAHIKGHYGKNQAPWPYAQLSIALDPSNGPKDLKAFKGIQFYAKGDGKNYKVVIQKDSVKDYADYEYLFTAGKDWTLVTISFNQFSQPSWGKPVPPGFSDATVLKFCPSVNDADFDLYIDDVAFVRDPAQKADLGTSSSDITELSLKQILDRHPSCRTISLASAADRNFKDDPQGAGPGWTGQGENSVYDMAFGTQVLQGIPFDISSTPNHQCVVLRGQNNAAYPTTVDIPVNGKGKALYFLQGAAWAAPHVGNYRVTYGDGSTVDIPIRNNVEIFDWWTPGTSAVARVGWTGANPKKDPVALTLFAWANPYPDKVITQVTASTAGDASYLMLAGLTLGQDGPYLVKLEPKVYDTKDWFAYQDVDVKAQKGTALDMSGLLDGPAGKHGRVKTQGDRFVFADGTPARFWGLNVVASANFPTHEQADWMAQTLAQMGCNMTRHHHMDAPWTNRNIFGNKDNTQTLDPESMDRFDYLVAQLQKRGIYQYFDMIVHRKAMASDGVKDPDTVPNGFKIEGEFDPKLIELEEGFIRQFLGHKNPYTGKTYAEDPAVCLMEVMNEDSLFYRSGDLGDFGIPSPAYRSEFNALFNQWLLKKFKTRKTLEARWAAKTGELGNRALGKDEDPKKGTVEVIGNWQDDSYKAYTRQRALDTFRFYYDTQLNYYRIIREFVRGLGCKSLMTGSNHWTDIPADLYANSQMDYIDRHNYWANIEGGYGYSPSVTFDPRSMLRDSKGGLMDPLGKKRVKGLPYIVTEWQSCAPNDYRHEAELLFSAYCDLQGWNALEFAFSHSDTFDGPLDNNFNVDNQPGQKGLWPATALLFHRHDVKEASDEFFAPMTPEEALDPASKLDLDPQLSLVAKTGIAFTDQKNQLLDPKQLLVSHSRNKVVTSDTGEVVLDYGNGILKLDTPRTQGFSGFTKGVPQSATNLEVTLKNDYGTVVASSLEDKPLGETGHILVSAIGNAINTGMETVPAGNKLKSPGSLPVLVEPMVGKVRLTQMTGDLDKVKVYALDPSGRRTSDVSFDRDGQTLTFEMRPGYKTMFYEITR
jgi:hypothetical protein